MTTQGFDRNNFAETEESLALIAKLGPDILLVEGQFFISSFLLTPTDSIRRYK